MQDGKGKLSMMSEKYACAINGTGIGVYSK